MPPIMITHLEFADDICLLSNEMGQAQHLLTRVDTEFLKVGLELNVKKTEIMTINTLLMAL